MCPFVYVCGSVMCAHANKVVALTTAGIIANDGGPFIPISGTTPCADTDNSNPTDCIGMSCCNSIRSVDGRSFHLGARKHA